VARKLRPLSPFPVQWFDPRDRLISAMEAEATQARDLVRTASFDPRWTQRSAIQRLLLSIFIRPYARLCAADRSAAELRNALVVRDLPRCTFQPGKVAETKTLPGNPIGAQGPDYAAALAARINRLRIDFEGTENILALKRTGPSISPAPSVCPDRKWIIDVFSGGAVIRLDPPLPDSPPALPTRHRVAMTSAQGLSAAFATRSTDSTSVSSRAASIIPSTCHPEPHVSSRAAARDLGGGLRK
jgi:hypothetical protein